MWKELNECENYTMVLVLKVKFIIFRVPLKIEVAIISLMLKLFLMICARVGVWGNKSEEQLSTIWSNKSEEQLGTI